ncbi:MAG: hypothetical protein [Arizlama microvirus]|nr:MAG: hypothetical protein [Arizlama microvirus]
MFRPNRIGTPIIHTPTTNFSTADITLAQNTRATVGHPCNIMNAAAVADFGFTSLTWNATEAVTANYKFGIAQQFTVTEPISGDAVGIELNFNGAFLLPASTMVCGFFGRLSAATAAVLANTATNENAHYFAAHQIQDPVDDTLIMTSFSYQEQLVLRDTDPTVLAGTYAHGIAIFDNSGAGWNFTQFHAAASVRQLNDQESVGYRDTRR